MLEFAHLLKTNLPVFLAVVTVLGLLVGSFLNVVIYRVPLMMEREWRRHCQEILAHGALPDGHADASGETPTRFDLIKPDSHCPHCDHAIPFYQNIPIISYIFLRGKCANCGHGIPLRYPAVELLTGILSFVVALQFGFSEQCLAALTLTWALIALSFIDYDHQLLPDLITLPVLWLGLLISTGEYFVDSHTSILGAAFGYFVLWLVFHIFKLVTGKEGMGYGDFKLLAMLGAWVGWKLLPLIILLSSLAGAIIGLALIVFRKHQKDKPIPFGPYLAIAGWMALVWGDEMMRHYLSILG